MGKVYQSIKKDFGTVNVQVSCAGIATYVDSLELTPETWHKVMRVNLDGTFWTAQAAAR